MAAMWNELLETEFCLDNKQPKDKKKKKRQPDHSGPKIRYTCLWCLPMSIHSFQFIHSFVHFSSMKQISRLDTRHSDKKALISLPIMSKLYLQPQKD